MSRTRVNQSGHWRNRPAMQQKVEPGLIEGLENICRYVGRSVPNTVRRWWWSHGFPMCKLPNGRWATTGSAIDQWIMARGRAQLERAKADNPDWGRKAFNRLLERERAREERPQR